jgi:hypothetical protein
MIALLQPTAAAGSVGTVEEYEGNDHFCRLHCFSHGDKVPSRLVRLLRLALQRRLCHNPWLQTNAYIGAQLLLFENLAITVGVHRGCVDGGAVAWCGVRGSSRLCVFVFVDAK